MLLREHSLTLEGKAAAGHVTLRPMTEKDWGLLERWNSDPEVLYYSEGDQIDTWTPEQVRYIYRSVSQNAFCFIIELGGEPVGECWLQRMNLDRVIRLYVGQDVRRIDLMIGEKRYWARGIGTEVVRMLTRFGFEDQAADVVYIPEIADYNIRSLRVFEKAGYRIVATREEKPGRKARNTYDLLMTRDDFLNSPLSRTS
jgi:aminoglycoside 6'-N-acetyltransferase